VAFSLALWRIDRFGHFGAGATDGLTQARPFPAGLSKGLRGYGSMSDDNELMIKYVLLPLIALAVGSWIVSYLLDSLAMGLIRAGFHCGPVWLAIFPC
jgi:hypothetical protein